MTITVKLFAILRDQTGISETNLHLTSGSTAAAAAALLAQKFPTIAKHLPKIAYAINEQYVPAATELQGGDDPPPRVARHTEAAQKKLPYRRRMRREAGPIRSSPYTAERNGPGTCRLCGRRNGVSATDEKPALASSARIAPTS